MCGNSLVQPWHNNLMLSVPQLASLEIVCSCSSPRQSPLSNPQLPNEHFDTVFSCSQPTSFHSTRNSFFTWHWKVCVSFFAIYIHSNKINNVVALIKCLLVLRCQLYMCRTTMVHPQELLCRNRKCRLRYVLIRPAGTTFEEELYISILQHTTLHITENRLMGCRTLYSDISEVPASSIIHPKWFIFFYYKASWILRFMYYCTIGPILWHYWYSLKAEVLYFIKYFCEVLTL